MLRACPKPELPGLEHNPEEGGEAPSSLCAVARRHRGHGCVTTRSLSEGKDMCSYNPMGVCMCVCVRAELEIWSPELAQAGLRDF